MALDQRDEDELAHPDDEPDREGPLARMPLTDHLEELRYRLILALIGPAVAMVITLMFGWSLVDWITKPLLQVLDMLGLPPQVYAFGVPTGFAVYIKVSLVAAIIIAFPWLLYQLWKFIESGLYAHEKKGIVLVAPFSALMSGLGVLFLYYLLLPVCLAFMLFFTTSFPAVDVQQSGERSFLSFVVQVMAGSYGMEEPKMGDVAGGGAGDDGGAGDPGGSGGPGGSNGTEGANGAGGDPDGSATQPAGTGGEGGQLARSLEAPVLEQDPVDPASGDLWIKVPEGQLRIAVGDRVYNFIPFISQSMMQPMMDINQYLSFVTWLALGVVLAFQLPVVMLILGWTQLVSPHWLGQYRNYCVFACFGLGAVFTPADPVSMLVLALPLWGLFELGLALMKLTYREPEYMD